MKRILRIKKAGHSGTLDALAQGVLVVAVGSATKLIPVLVSNARNVISIVFKEYKDL